MNKTSKGQISMDESSRKTPNPKFSILIPKIKKFHILNAQFLNPNFQVANVQNLKFKISSFKSSKISSFKNSEFNFKTFSFQNFKNKIQTLDFIIKISSLNFQNPKSQNFRFQVPNFNSKSQSFKVSNFKFQFQNSQISKVKCFSKIESFVNQT